jgi:imidazolonepropionase-like amidohydrolase
MRRVNSGARRSRFAAAVTLLAACAGLRAEVPSAIAIKDARVVTVSGEDLPKATVLLRDGLIQDVGAGLTIPGDAWVIDGAGLTVYPGFIDGLSRWGLAGDGARTAAAGRAHGPEDRPQTYSFERAADMLDPADHRLEAARGAGFTAAATFPDRGIFEGLGAMIGLGGDHARDMVIAQPIGQQVTFRIARGPARGGYPASLMGNIAYVRQLYLDLDRYKQAKETRRPEYDHALEGLAESPRVLLPADEAQQIDRMLNFAPELKTPVLLYGLHEAYRRIDTLKQTHVPLLVSLKWPEKSHDAGQDDTANYRELLMREQAPAVPGLLARAGLKFGFYSDGIDTATGLRQAVKKAIDAGLPRADAIRALTRNVAEMYGVADRLGTIERGKIANLVVTKGDVFEEKTTIEYVFVDGRKFEPVKEAHD